MKCSRRQAGRSHVAIVRSAAPAAITIVRRRKPRQRPGLHPAGESESRRSLHPGGGTGSQGCLAPPWETPSMCAISSNCAIARHDGRARPMSPRLCAPPFWPRWQAGHGVAPTSERLSRGSATPAAAKVSELGALRMSSPPVLPAGMSGSMRGRQNGNKLETGPGDLAALPVRRAAVQRI
jgi:hypothetical protein